MSRCVVFSIITWMKVYSCHIRGVMLFNPEQAHDGMVHDENGLDYVMLYIEPDMMLEATEQKDIVLFKEPIVYERRLRQSIVKLANAILMEKDEALNSELFLNLTDTLLQTNLPSSLKKDDKLIEIAKDMLQAEFEQRVKSW